jgi:hypothetical protein
MRIGDRRASIAWAEARTIGVSARQYNIDQVTWLAKLLIAEYLATGSQGSAETEFLQIGIPVKNDYCLRFSRYLRAVFVRVRTVTILCLSMFKCGFGRQTEIVSIESKNPTSFECCEREVRLRREAHAF